VQLAHSPYPRDGSTDHISESYTTSGKITVSHTIFWKVDTMTIVSNGNAFLRETN
jgi:hypothetical protein